MQSGIGFEQEYYINWFKAREKSIVLIDIQKQKG